MLNQWAENGTSFLNSRNEIIDFFVANQWFWEKNIQSPQAESILSDVFKILREEIFISSDEKEFSWDGFFEMSHKITRINRDFFASKHKQPQKRAIFLRFHQKAAIFKSAENRVFPPSLLVAWIFVLNGGGKPRKVSLNKWKVATAMNEKKPHQQSIC